MRGASLSGQLGKQARRGTARPWVVPAAPARQEVEDVDDAMTGERAGEIIETAKRQEADKKAARAAAEKETDADRRGEEVER